MATKTKEEVKEVKAEKKAASTAKKAASTAKAQDKATATKIEVKKTVRSGEQKVKTAVKNVGAKVEKKVEKANTGKIDIVIQSPMGGAITPEEIVKKVPKTATNVYVRIDENKLYYVLKNGEAGSVDIWE